MFFKTIRFKITILYMAILALTISSFSIILYHNVKTGLERNMDTLLVSKAHGVTQSIDAYWEASKFGAAEEGTRPEVLKKRRNIDFTKVAQRWVREESNDPALLDIIVQVFDTDGVIIASSKNALGLDGISQKPFISVLQGKSRFDTMASDSQPNRITLRIYTAPVFENEKVAYIVQVASPIASMQNALNNLKVALFLLLPITVLATGVMGALLAKATLHPVNSMIDTIHQITAQNMKLKLKIPDTRDEVQKLAETFNIMLARLESAFTTQRQLFEDLSHELKTPLTILKGELEVMLKKVRSPQEYELVLKSSLEEINKITRLIESLLVLAKFEATEALPEKKILDLKMLLQGIIKNIRRVAESRMIEIQLASQDGLSIYGDEDQLKALFLNILDNAIKYTPSEGKVTIRTARDDTKVRVMISDTGVGIPQDELRHIFDRFYRVDKSRSNSGCSFGLGLSIAKSITEAHGGLIGVDSQPSVGTTFTVMLPLA